MRYRGYSYQLSILVILLQKKRHFGKHFHAFFDSGLCTKFAYFNRNPRPVFNATDNKQTGFSIEIGWPLCAICIVTLKLYAVISDAPELVYYTNALGRVTARMVGSVFMRKDGTYEEIYRHWFGFSAD